MGLKVTRPIATYTLTTLLLFVVLGVAGAHLLGLWGLTVAYVLAYAAQWLLAARAVRLERRSSGLSPARADAPNDMDNPLWP